MAHGEEPKGCHSPSGLAPNATRRHRCSHDSSRGNLIGFPQGKYPCAQIQPSVPRVAPHGAVGRFGRLAFCANGSQAERMAPRLTPTSLHRQTGGGCIRARYSLSRWRISSTAWASKSSWTSSGFFKPISCIEPLTGDKCIPSIGRLAQSNPCQTRAAGLWPEESRVAAGLAANAVTWSGDDAAVTRCWPMPVPSQS